MKKITLEIDGKKVETQEGRTLLEAAKEIGINIPTLCYNEGLSPYGACRLCMVEISKGGRKRLVASCVYPVENDLIVRTDTERVRQIRKMILELLWPAFEHKAREYGLTESRFTRERTDCSLCGLCVRTCAQPGRPGVAFFKGRGVERHVDFLPGKEAECSYCKVCYNLCTEGYIVTH